MLQEKKAIESYFKYHVETDESLLALFSDDSGYNELLKNYYKPVSQELQEWMSAPYEQNPAFPEQLIHKGVSGNLLRSKSETIIDMFLYYNQIPYRYEAELILGHVSFHPDFTIRHPKTGEIFYWEHFGLMDDPSYYQKTFSKLQLYAYHGIIPSINLITTYETQTNTLSADMVEKIVKQYFL